MVTKEINMQECRQISKVKSSPGKYRIIFGSTYNISGGLRLQTRAYDVISMMEHIYR